MEVFPDYKEIRNQLIEWRESKLLIEGNKVKAYYLKVSGMATQPS